MAAERRPERPGAAEVPAESVTSLLQAWRGGDERAGDRVMSAVYSELHRIAQNRMRSERTDHTLQATELVNEAYLRLVGAELSWQDRRHFYAVAARTMRRILVDHARAQRRQKRGGVQERVDLDDAALVDPGRLPDLVALDEALDRLGEQDERKAKAVELLYFAGLSYEEIAHTLDVSPATVHRDLRLAKAWLYQQLR